MGEIPIENALGKTFIYLEVHIRCTLITSIMSFTCQMDNGINLRKISAIQIVP